MLFNVECPSCRRKGVKTNFHRIEVPYFGEVMQTVIQCDCGYHHADVLTLEKKDPVRYSIKIGEEKDLNIRVIRSGSSTIRIPELGVEVTPGIASEGYISNVEGVLTRLEDVLVTAKGWRRNRVKAEELLRKIGRVKRGEEAVHLIIEDPSGHSAIISDKALKEAL